MEGCSLRICYVADAATVHARNLISYFSEERRHDVLVLSTSPPSGVTIPNAIVVELDEGSTVLEDRRKRSVGQRTKEWFNALSRVAAPWFPALHRVYSGYQRWRSLAHVRRWIPVATQCVGEFKPQIVHALRLQVEGFLAARLDVHPLVLSTWGNDLLYWASSSRAYNRWTRMTMPRVDGLIADNKRDLYLGELYGFRADRPQLAMPATGGIPPDELAHLASIDRASARQVLGFASDDVVIMSVRGFYRAYINTVGLIDAIPQVLQSEPRAIFIVDGKGRLNSGAHLYLERRARQLGVAHRVRFTSLTRPELFNTLRAADVIVSSVLYDGLPISMLEGMAAGLIPVYSNQSPILEYIRPGVNGFVIDPRDPRDIAVQLIRAVRMCQRRADVAAHNAQLLAEKADRGANLARIDALYGALARAHA